MKATITLAVALMVSVGIIAAQQAPIIAGWHSLTAVGGAAAPLPLAQSDCLVRAEGALQAEGFSNLRSQDGWTTSGVRGPLAAGISCVAVGGSSQVDLTVSGPRSSGTEVNRMRDMLRDRMLGLPSSTTSNPSGDPASGGSDSFARLYADIAVAIAEVGRTEIGWVDGIDPNGPVNDAGRGIASWQVHYNHAANSQRAAGVPALVTGRLEQIQENVDAAAYANLYSTISVQIAKWGRETQGWIDGRDPSAGADQGRGISSRTVHYQHAASNRENARGSIVLIGWRLGGAEGGRHAQSSGQQTPPPTPLSESAASEAFARLYADLATTIAEAGRAHLSWADGMDSAAPPSDRGRGISNWQLHFDHAAMPANQGAVPELIRDRMRAIQERVTPQEYAAVYADVSVRIAQFGREYLGWIDGLDSSAGSDPRRGISSRDTHYQHALSNPGASHPVAGLIGGRLRTATEARLSYMPLIGEALEEVRPPLTRARDSLVGRWHFLSQEPTQVGTLDIRATGQDTFAGTILLSDGGGSTTAISVAGVVFSYPDTPVNEQFWFSMTGRLADRKLTYQGVWMMSGTTPVIRGRMQATRGFNDEVVELRDFQAVQNL